MQSSLLSTSGTTRRAQERPARRDVRAGLLCRHAAHVSRFWLPDAGPFACVSFDLDRHSYLFSLRCYRRGADNPLVLATSTLNRFRLRELEDTLVELHLVLPPVLQRYLVATLSDDAGTAEALLPRVRALMCCHERRRGQGVGNAAGTAA